MKDNQLFLSLFYWNSNHIENFKKERKSFLENLRREVIGNSTFEGVYVNFSREGGELNGNVHLTDIYNSWEGLYVAADYILSKGKKNLPVAASITGKENYSMIESILKTHYRDSVKLTNGFLAIPRMFGQREIKVLDKFPKL